MKRAAAVFPHTSPPALMQRMAIVCASVCQSDCHRSRLKWSRERFALRGTSLTSHLLSCGLGDQDRPDSIPRLAQVVAFHMTTTRKYFMPEGAVDEKSLAAFAKGVVDGTVEPFFKSEAVPSGERPSAPTYLYMYYPLFGQVPHQYLVRGLTDSQSVSSFSDFPSS